MKSTLEGVRDNLGEVGAIDQSYLFIFVQDIGFYKLFTCSIRLNFPNIAVFRFGPHTLMI